MRDSSGISGVSGVQVVTFGQGGRDRIPVASLTRTGHPRLWAESTGVDLWQTLRLPLLIAWVTDESWYAGPAYSVAQMVKASQILR